MSLTITANNGNDFEMTPEGTYVGRCIKVIDLGTQTTNGQRGAKQQKKVMITWELLDDEVKMGDGRPFAVTQWYTASLYEAAQLRKDLESWRGTKFTEQELEGFDLLDILGTYCLIQVIHSKDGQYANVQTIMHFKGEKPKGVNELVSFDISNPDMEVLKSFSDKMQQKIMGTPEWRERESVTNILVDQADDAKGSDPGDMPKDFLKN